MTVVLILANRSTFAGKKQDLIGRVWRSWKVIDVMRLMSLAGVNNRSRLLSLVSSWLTSIVIHSNGVEAYAKDGAFSTSVTNGVQFSWNTGEYIQLVRFSSSAQEKHFSCLCALKPAQM